MEITYTAALKLIGVVCSLTKDSPLKKVSKNELEAAVREINNLKYYSNQRECLLGVLGHLESAYSQFEPSTWDFLDNENRVLWDQRTYKNDICMTIAVIHYVLGNIDRARVWLSDELSDYGWIHMPDGSLDLLEYSKTEDFFNAIYRDDGNTYKKLERAIEINYYNAYDLGNTSYSDYDYYQY